MAEVALWKVLAVIGVSILVGTSGAYTTYAAFSDDETASVGVSAANDFTVDVGQFEVSPKTVSVERDGTFTIRVDVPDSEAVETDRFALEAVGREGSITARSAGTTCKRGEHVCKVKFSTAEFRALAGGAGTYAVRLRGWWTYDQAFVATGTITLEVADDDSKAVGNDADISVESSDDSSTTTSGASNVTATETTTHEVTTTTETVVTTETARESPKNTTETVTTTSETTGTSTSNATTETTSAERTTDQTSGA